MPIIGHTTLMLIFIGLAAGMASGFLGLRRRHSLALL